MARHKGRPVGNILKEFEGYLPEDSTEISWADIEKKALKEGYSKRTLTKYMRLLESGGKMTKHLDTKKIGRPRYLYRRQNEQDKLRRFADQKGVKGLMEDVTLKVRQSNSIDEQSRIMGIFFSYFIPEIALSVAEMLSKYASFENKEDAETYLDVNIELDLIPIIKELAHNIPQNIDKWAPAVNDFFDNVIAPTRDKVSEKMNKLIYDE